MKEVGQPLIHIPLPLWQIGNRKNRIHPVVSARVDCLNIEIIQFKYAEYISILDNTLGMAGTMVPHVVCLFIERQAVERSQVHGCKSVIVFPSYAYPLI